MPSFPSRARGRASRPASYGATKRATEAYLMAATHRTAMRGNIVRPGYTFGNPVVPGATMQSDTRFKDIVANAKAASRRTSSSLSLSAFVSSGMAARARPPMPG